MAWLQSQHRAEALRLSFEVFRQPLSWKGIGNQPVLLKLNAEVMVIGKGSGHRRRNGSNGGSRSLDEELIDAGGIAGRGRRRGAD